MFNGFAKVTTGIDKTGDIKKFLDELANKQVYVGIPEGNDERGDVQYKATHARGPKGGVGSNSRTGGDISNAELLYIQTHGIREKEMRDEMNPKVESGQMPYSKAYKMWLHTHGSPLWQSPPRPVIEPAIEDSKDVIAKQLRKVATTALDGQDPSAELEKAGMLGQNVVRAWFVNPANGWALNSPITARRKGSDKPLIDSGEMRKAITYVVTDGK